MKNIRCVVIHPNMIPQFRTIPNKIVNLENLITGKPSCEIMEDFTVIYDRDAVKKHKTANETIDGSRFYGTIVLTGGDLDKLANFPMSPKEFARKYRGLYKRPENIYGEGDTWD